MDDFGPETEAPEIKECSVCKNQQRQTPATSWCFSCVSAFCGGCLTMHGAMPLSRDHEVVVLSESTKYKMVPKRPFMCKLHVSKRIELFCKDCKVAICTICCSINHRKCHDVDTIENMTPQVKKQLTKQNQELNVRIGNTEHGISVRRRHVDDFRNTVEEVKSQIRSARAKVVAIIVKKEKQLLDDVDQSSTTQLQQIQADIKSQEIELQKYQQQYKFTANAVTSNCEMDMYAVYESVDEASPDNRDTDNTPGRVVFTHDIDKLSKAVHELQLGEVKLVHDVCDRESTPTLHQVIDCKTEDDPIYSVLRDVSVLTVDGVHVVVVTDLGKERLNTYYTHAMHSPKYIQLSNGPSHITQLANCRVAVSVPASMEIVIVKVYPEPVLLSTIKTSNKYYGLAYLSPSLLVAGGIRRTDILDMTGKVLKSIKTGLVSSPDYIHVTSNRNLIVSERLEQSLVCVTSEGDDIFTYTPTGDRALNYPQGITTTSTGDILLVDRYRVIQLTESGQFVRDVLTAQDGVDYPHGICLDRDGLLYVTCVNCVKIFKF
ncbi:E3 ubiquitin-protein ligase TRIM9-like [Haliotis rufescens]|uniref:E3 ubiquitin-protein ligase TRIM9-like n=1 Tax=Haliotis rufescens TaxID=6454 RepID=UPI00201F3B3C|nr:E3 ubiquitin-protein ligase TRIM9-like [Haliotis rufescens]